MSQSDPLPLPMANIVGSSVPAVVPSACRDSAQGHAEVTVEDRVPANVLLNSELCTLPDLESAEKLEAADIEVEMAKQADLLAIPALTSSYGCKSFTPNYACKN